MRDETQISHMPRATRSRCTCKERTSKPGNYDLTLGHDSVKEFPVSILGDPEKNMHWVPSMFHSVSLLLPTYHSSDWHLLVFHRATCSANNIMIGVVVFLPAINRPTDIPLERRALQLATLYMERLMLTGTQRLLFRVPSNWPSISTGVAWTMLQ